MRCLGTANTIAVVWLVYFRLRKIDYITAVIPLASVLRKGDMLMYILRASFTDKFGVKHYARDYGKRAFRIWIGPGPEPIRK